MKAIQAGTPIDGLADEPRKDMEILVEDGTVTGVRVIETGDAPPDATVLDEDPLQDIDVLGRVSRV